MRKAITGSIAALAILATAPAMACGVDGYAGPCPSYVVVPAGVYYRETFAFEQLPDPEPGLNDAGPRYYYVNQGPAYSGPGMYAPLPTYQERAVSGWSGYEQGYYYDYNGGPYGDATSHYYDGMPNVRGPVVYRYPPRQVYRGSRKNPGPRIIEK